MSFTHRLSSTGETSPPGATPAPMLRRVDVAELKDDWYVRLWLTRRLLSTAADLPTGDDRPRAILKTVILFIAEYDCAA
jgi:hypothetical protein